VTVRVQGCFVEIDKSDLPVIRSRRWRVAHREGRSYVVAGGGKRGAVVSLHRAILNPPPGVPVDHINGDGLDNRRSNLRACSTAENVRNSRKYAAHRATSKFKGVCLDRGKYRAQIALPGRKLNLGRFASEEEAARAYDAAALQHFGEFARLNFPPVLGAPSPVCGGAR
jgi:hypothetical protein